MAPGRRRRRGLDALPVGRGVRPDRRRTSPGGGDRLAGIARLWRQHRGRRAVRHHRRAVAAARAVAQHRLEPRGRRRRAARKARRPRHDRRADQQLRSRIFGCAARGGRCAGGAARQGLRAGSPRARLGRLSHTPGPYLVRADRRRACASGRRATQRSSGTAQRGARAARPRFQGRPEPGERNRVRERTHRPRLAAFGAPARLGRWHRRDELRESARANLGVRRGGAGSAQVERARPGRAAPARVSGRQRDSRGERRPAHTGSFEPARDPACPWRRARGI